jgi:hypothetical protein
MVTPPFYNQQKRPSLQMTSTMALSMVSYGDDASKESSTATDSSSIGHGGAPQVPETTIGDGSIDIKNACQ